MAVLTAAGLPAVLVPLPHATADHQAANARAVAAAGGAVVVDDAALDGPALVAAAAPLLADPDRLAAMAAGMRTQAHPAAAEELAALVVEASGRATRDQYLAELAAAAPPIDREASGWFESAAPTAGPTTQRRVDRRTKRMEAYPPVDRQARAAVQGQGSGSGTAEAQGSGAGSPGAEGPGTGSAGATGSEAGSSGFQDPGTGTAGAQGPGAREALRNGHDPQATRNPDAPSGGPPTDQDPGP